MVEFVMSSDKFYKSLRSYIKNNVYKTVITKNLFDEFDKNFEAVDGVGITQFLQEWIFKNGYPYVNVTRENNQIRLSQSQYFVNQPQTPSSTKWIVPITYYKDNKWDTSSTGLHFLKESSSLFTDIPIEQKLLKLNAANKGYYLVNYFPEMWNQWIDALVNDYSNTKLPMNDRAGLLLDSFALAEANLLKYDVPLRLSQYLVYETEYSPWLLAIYNLAQIKKYVMISSKHSDKFETYLQKLVKPISDKLGYSFTADESMAKARLRVSVINFACSVKYEPCLEKMSREFQKWKTAKQSNDSTTILRPEILNLVLEYGSSKMDWQYMWSLYLNETTYSSMKKTYIYSLINVDDQSLIESLLSQATTSNLLDPYDALQIFSTVAESNNKDTLETLWNYVKTNYAQMNFLTTSQLSTLFNKISDNYILTKNQQINVSSICLVLIL